MSNSRAGFLDVVCSLYLQKDANGFYSMSEKWNKSEAINWGIDYTRTTYKIIALLKSINVSRAKMGVSYISQAQKLSLDY